ncbi:MAG: DUF3868 domain-containing protein [Porphyromonadaceae bacterium]|nr:DUF3868 domain-containing protein [Porphyromonadaceae bacterium]
MKRKITATIAMMFVCGAMLSAQTPQETAVGTDGVDDVNPETGLAGEGVIVERSGIGRSGNFLKVGLDIDLTGMHVKNNRAVLLTPHLVGGADSLDLPSVGIYGRQRYIFYVRNGKGMLAEEEDSYREKDKPDQLNYSHVLECPAWAAGEQLKLHLRWTEWGCCNGLLDTRDSVLFAEAIAFFPPLIYVRPEGQSVKERSLSGSARVEFVVDKTDVRPDYRNNRTELGKIQGTIDSVRSDSDVTVTGVFLKGYASPEDTYAHNTDLARGRTDAVKEYVRGLYDFEDSVFETDFEPEDWEGLREFVVNSTALKHREEILETIDGSLEPDAKERKIRSSWPEDYRYLLENCYPALRHTYYEIFYTIRTYTDIGEIRRIFETNPQKLSLNEFYLLSEEYESGSREFLDVFETAVRMYPDDEAANLNAGNAAIRRFEFSKAGKYLERAGQSGEAEYARGALAYWTSDYEAALEHFRNALGAGIEAAAELITTLEDTDRDRIEASRKAAIRSLFDHAVEN